ncbi:MAG TPA: hypothetical protein VHY22_09555 [Chthoniobacteraceae bacterium]|jgi:hypothetical protein|nr:hypothetical protein [Chthoniobacteraceae bacterium]
MLRRLFEEQYAAPCPFSREKELDALNCAILYAIRDHLRIRPLTPKEMGELLEDCQRLERESRALDGESRIYAERTVDLAKFIMGSDQAGIEKGRQNCNPALAVPG